MTFLFKHLPRGCNWVLVKGTLVVYVNSELCDNQPTRTCKGDTCCLGKTDCGKAKCCRKNTAVPQQGGSIL